MNKDFKLPIAFQDESAMIDRELLLIARLCAAADWDEECDAELVKGIGSSIKEYLRRRNALESVFGRVENYYDDEFKVMAAAFRKKLAGRK